MKSIHILFLVLSVLAMSCSSPCHGSPLECGTIDIQFQAGVCPIKWGHGFSATTRSFASVLQSSTLTLFRHPRFSAFYHVPWIIGGQLGYASSECVRLYAEANYVQARAKQNVSFFTDSAPSLSAQIVFTRYSLYDAFIGGRYYTQRCCAKTLSYFLGGKIGFTRHHAHTFDLIIGTNQTYLEQVPAFDRNTGLSGGINGGFDLCCNNWSFVVTAEVVISKGPQVSNDLVLTPPVSNIFSSLFLGKVGNELCFPVTVAVRYTF